MDPLKIIKTATKKNMEEFCKKFQLSFWLDTPYCIGRRTKNETTPCEGCESQAMCLIAMRLLDNSIDIYNKQRKIEMITDYLKEQVRHGK